MAFAARLGSLTEELIEALEPDLKNDAKAARLARDAALHKLKSHTYLRTNQFEVKSHLDGLEERFRINDREALADALRKRLDAFDQAPEPWHPEILSLLLELSDQPTFKTRLSDLDALRADEQEPDTLFRWEDVAREEGWDKDPDIWASIRYSDSSDDDAYQEAHDDTQSVSSTDDSEVAGRLPEDLVISPQNAQTLDSVRDAQRWRAEAPKRNASGHALKIAISEIQVAREVLFMLQGLETTLFQINCSVAPAFQTSHLAWETHKAVLNAFAEYGRQLRILRTFVKQSQDVPLIQVSQACISKRLQKFDAQVTQIEARFVSPNKQVILSLMAVKGELDAPMELLVSLANVVAQFQNTSRSNAFHYLELLFEASSLSQGTGAHSTYEFLARIFIDCFNVYLRPIRTWMDEGRLIPDDEIFFVSDTSVGVPLSRIWQDRFALRKNANNGLHAPNFLQPAVSKIFNAGKNIVILKQLGEFGARHERIDEESPLDFDTVCPPGYHFAPFPDLFDAAFERWIQSKYRKTSTILKDVLFTKYHLAHQINSLQHLYFMSDGSAAASFCDELFVNLDVLKRTWHDRYALTGLGQEAFAAVLDTSHVIVDVEQAGKQCTAASARDSVKTALPSIMISYRLAWPVQMIISEESIAHYRAVFTLLLQVKRAFYALHKTRLLDGQGSEDDLWEESALFYSSRNDLVWFCTTILTYLSTLVLAPNTSSMQHDVEAAQDVDAMISIHTTAMKRIIDQACLGSRLTPIRECILDILDLAIKLEQARSAAGARNVRRGDGSEEETNIDEGYSIVLKRIKADFDKHLRFICGGLKSVARASSDSQSAKWDMLAEMLQSGSRDDRR